MAADVKDLKVWQAAIGICKDVYLQTRAFPAEEHSGLRRQMRRCAVSIPSNLAEGYGRGTRKDYRQFVCISRGSACELETQLILAAELGFMSGDASMHLQSRLREILRMLSGLIRSLETP